MTAYYGFKLREQPEPIKDETLVALAEALFQLDGCISWNHPEDTPANIADLDPQFKPIIDKMNAIMQIFILEGLMDPWGAFLVHPDRLEFKKLMQ